MEKKQKLFECLSGNTFRIAQPQPMGMMAETGQGQGHKVRLTLARKTETNEWLVKVYIDGKFQEGPTYYTDDKQDAIDTAKMMMQHYQQQGYEIEKGKTVSLVRPEPPTSSPSMPQELGEGKSMQVSGEQFDRIWYAVLKKGQRDDNGDITHGDWAIHGYSRNGLEEFGQLTYKGMSVFNRDAGKQDGPPGT